MTRAEYDPLTWLVSDRAKARTANDPWANLCVLTTVDRGLPQARVLVLRDIQDRLAVFLNATSPKQRQIAANAQVSVLTFLASCGVQYRIAATTTPIPQSVVHGSWRDRPRIPKVMDWLYHHHAPQSTVVSSRDALKSMYETVHATLAADPDAPPGAIGYFIDPYEVERLQLAGDDIHSRERFSLADERWRRDVLIP